MDICNILALILFYVYVSNCVKDFAACHNNFDFNAPDGLLRERNIFPWLGFLRYVHLTTNTAHPTSAPRVVLVQKQFVLTTAKEVYQVPYNFKIGYIIFGHYDREEDDCGLLQHQARIGMTCGPAYMEMPVLDLIPHPEYSRFRTQNSLALIKLLNPLGSQYMIPVCLPTFIERQEQRKRRRVMMIDYVSSVPLDFDEEAMAKKTLRLYSHKHCRRLKGEAKLPADSVTRMLCTSGCGVRVGAPIITYTNIGTFEVMGLAITSGQCTHRGMRHRLNKDPPIYIDIYPYIAWIMNVVTAHIIPLPYPHHMTSVADGYHDERESHRKFFGGVLRTKKRQLAGWSSRTFMVGNWCFNRSPKAQKRHLAFFYSEKFSVVNTEKTNVKVLLKLSAGVDCTICCVRMRLPSKKTKPWIDGVGGFNITMIFNTGWFPNNFTFYVSVTGKNTTPTDMITFLDEIPRPNYWFKP